MMWNIKNKLFEDYKKERLTLFNMGFILLMRMVSYALSAILIVCLFVGLILPILLASFRNWVLEPLWGKGKRRLCGEMAAAMCHEIEKRIHNIIENVFFAL